MVKFIKSVKPTSAGSHGPTALLRGGFLMALIILVGLVTPASAEKPLSQPKDRVILTVSGAIDKTNHGSTARFDRAMLEAIGVARIRTTSSWTDGVAEFEGVLARDLLRALGTRGTVVSATALNDYTIKIPVSDFENYDVVLAYRMNQVDLTARDKGPIWIVYPRDRHPELMNQKADSKWIWQLVSLEIE